MKGLLLPAVMAIAVHALILGLDVKWTERGSQPVPAHRAVTLALTYFSPDRELIPPMPRTVEPEPTPAEKNAAPFKKEEARQRPHSQASKQTMESPRADDREPAMASLPVRAEPLQEAVVVTGAQDSELTPPSDAAVPDANAKMPPLSTDPVLREAHPAYRKNPRPGYPQLAKRRGIEGTVLLEVLVSSEGAVKDFRVFRSSGQDILDHAALGAVRTWVFEPARRGDEAVEMWVKIPIRFELK